MNINPFIHFLTAMFQEDSPIHENISANWGRRRGFISSADQDTRVVEEESNV